MAIPSTQTIAIAANLSLTLEVSADKTRLKLDFLPIMPRLQKHELAKLIQILEACEAKMAQAPI